MKPNALLMTCQVLVTANNGLSAKARALLDAGSSASFISEWLAKSLHLRRQKQSITVTGIGGLTHPGASHDTTSFRVSSLIGSSEDFNVSAVVIPRVTCHLPTSSTPPQSNWSHIEGLQLADPTFCQPGAVDLLLGVDVFVSSLLHGRRSGALGSPTALETKFGWVLAGDTHGNVSLPVQHVSHHTTALAGDDMLRKFWELEETPSEPVFSVEEKAVVEHFKENHFRLPDGRFVVPLPKRDDVSKIGESRSQAVRRFLPLERSLHSKEQFSAFADVIEEYFSLCHAKEVPLVDLQKPPCDVFYLPMHAVHKQASTTTKLRVVFDASAKSSSGISLNDTLMVGPALHSSLLDVLLRFRCHVVAITADISKMYRAVELAPSDKDYHRFIWRLDPRDPLIDYRMRRLTFGVSASSFAANMSVAQNAVDFSNEHPLASLVIKTSLYVDDCLTGADSIEEAARLQTDLQQLFGKAQFLLRKWNSSHPAALEHVSPELKESHASQALPDGSEYHKTLGIEWNCRKDLLRLAVFTGPNINTLTKRLLTSEIARTFDVLGLFAPSTIKAKILLQRIWEKGIDWDEAVPPDIYRTYQKWRVELSILSNKIIPRCYFPCCSRDCEIQLHGFSDASEEAYAAVVYLRVQAPDNSIHVSFVMSKTRVAPLKRLTIPRLELCGALLLAKILSHVQRTLDYSSCEVHAWTDSTVVLGWLNGDPRRFKTFFGNRVSQITDLIAPSKWSHVCGTDNPADCASRGIFPSELIDHDLWWSGPPWLHQDPSHWPKHTDGLGSVVPCDEVDQEIICLASVDQPTGFIDFKRYSKYSHLQRVVAWMVRFIHNCTPGSTRQHGSLTTIELGKAELYLWLRSQSDDFLPEKRVLQSGSPLTKRSRLRTLNPVIEKSGLLRVGGRVHNSDFSFAQRHPVILHGNHPLTKLLISAEHIRLLHAGPALVSSSLGRNFHIVGLRRVVRTITRACVICRRTTTRPQNQLEGQLPVERITPGIVFQQVGVDYAGPVYLRVGHVRKPTFVKAYIGVFVSFTIKAVHLELVSDLTSASFIACLRRFVARCGKPHTIWSDHGSNFVGAERELADLAAFLEEQQKNGEISDFCSHQMIQWVYIPRST